MVPVPVWIAPGVVVLSGVSVSVRTKANRASLTRVGVKLDTKPTFRVLTWAMLATRSSGVTLLLVWTIRLSCTIQSSLKRADKLCLLLILQSSLPDQRWLLMGCCTVTAPEAGVKVRGTAWRLSSQLPNQNNLSLINGPPSVNPPSLRWNGALGQPSTFTVVCVGVPMPVKSESGQRTAPPTPVGFDDCGMALWSRPKL